VIGALRACQSGALGQCSFSRAAPPWHRCVLPHQQQICPSPAEFTLKQNHPSHQIRTGEAVAGWACVRGGMAAAWCWRRAAVRADSSSCGAHSMLLHLPSTAVYFWRLQRCFWGRHTPLLLVVMAQASTLFVTGAWATSCCPTATGAATTTTAAVISRNSIANKCNRHRLYHVMSTPLLLSQTRPRSN
jgi:hypothetical protein